MSLDDCRDLVEAVTDFLEGALPPDEAATVVQHLAGCTGCATYVDQARATVAALAARGSLPEPPLPAATVERLLSAYREATA